MARSTIALFPVRAASRNSDTSAYVMGRDDGCVWMVPSTKLAGDIMMWGGVYG